MTHFNNHYQTTNNIDILRLFLAFSVCFSHLGEVSGIADFKPLARFFYSGVAVDSFFVLSGFLIFRSFERSSSPVSYLKKRIRRICPAYFLVIIMAAAFLPLFFTENPADLFFQPVWYRYLGTNLFFMNFLQPDLPGIFSNNPLQVINAPLWTIKVEVMFYLMVPIIFIFFRKSRRWTVLILLYLFSMAWSSFFLHLYSRDGLAIWLKYEKQLPGQLAFFLSGGALYFYFSIFKKYRFYFLFSALAVMALQIFIPVTLLYPPALAVIVLWFAFFMPHLGNWGKFGDMSYGVYIYHFPLIQTFTAASIFDRHPWLAFATLVTSILCVSWLSYRFIERPFLRRGSHYRLASEGKVSP